MKWLAISLLVLTAASGTAQEDPQKGIASKDHDAAVKLLESRGNSVTESEKGTAVVLLPGVDDMRVTSVDIRAVNKLRNVIEFRIVASEGIEPAVFEELEPLPNVNLVVIHYRMPGDSIQYLNRFPNVEVLKFWADSFVSCEKLPNLKKLRVLHHESTQGDFTKEGVEKIAECKNLEEIVILRPIEPAGVKLLKGLPKWKTIEVKGKVHENPTKAR